MVAEASYSWIEALLDTYKFHFNQTLFLDVGSMRVSRYREYMCTYRSQERPMPTHILKIQTLMIALVKTTRKGNR